MRACIPNQGSAQLAPNKFETYLDRSGFADEPRSIYRSHKAETLARNGRNKRQSVRRPNPATWAWEAGNRDPNKPNSMLTDLKRRIRSELDAGRKRRRRFPSPLRNWTRIDRAVASPPATYPGPSRLAKSPVNSAQFSGQRDGKAVVFNAATDEGPRRCHRGGVCRARSLIHWRPNCNARQSSRGSPSSRVSSPDSARRT